MRAVEATLPKNYGFVYLSAIYEAADKVLDEFDKRFNKTTKDDPEIISEPRCEHSRAMFNLNFNKHYCPECHKIYDRGEWIFPAKAATKCEHKTYLADIETGWKVCGDCGHPLELITEKFRPACLFPHTKIVDPPDICECGAELLKGKAYTPLKKDYPEQQYRLSADKKTMTCLDCGKVYSCQRWNGKKT